MLTLACLLSLWFVCACADPYDASSADSNELTSRGKLRVGIGVGPVGSAFWAVRDEITGTPRGVTVDLAAALARRLAVPLELVEYANSGELISGAARGQWDVAFAPVDEQRKTVVDFGPAYYVFESTYLVPGGSAIQNIAEVDRPGVRVVGIGETTTARAAIRSLHNARFVAVRTVEEAEKTLLSGEAHAVALGRESLVSVAARIGGARILAGSFQSTGVAVAVPKNRPAALAYVTSFIEGALASGLVQQALDNAGIKGTAANAVSRP